MLALLPTDGSDPLVELVEIPEPSTAGDEALIQVEAFSINRGETFLLECPGRDWRPGRDVSGCVVRTPADGSGPATGQRVVGHPQQAGWAQLAAVPSNALAVLPDQVGPYDVAFESIGGSSLPQALKLLVKGGRLIWLGQASRTPSQLDFFEFFAQTGATIRHFDHDDSAVPDSRDLATLVRLVASDRLHPEIGVVADWRQTASILEDLRERRIRGNAVLRIDHESQPPRPKPPGDEK
jgi:NADPH:quinone reductase-like Zn-dependent oxidoreductase